MGIQILSVFAARIGYVSAEPSLFRTQFSP